jgi:hypothetical protein
MAHVDPFLATSLAEKIINKGFIRKELDDPVNIAQRLVHILFIELKNDQAIVFVPLTDLARSLLSYKTRDELRALCPGEPIEFNILDLSLVMLEEHVATLVSERNLSVGDDLNGFIITIIEILVNRLLLMDISTMIF